jgi:hypothetical protein
MAPPLDPIASLRAALCGHYDIEREIGQGAFATAQAEYYLWVDSTPDSKASWTLLELSKVTDSAYAALPKNLNYCHKYTYAPVSEADFARDRKEGACDIPIPEPNPKVSQASLVSSSVVIALLKHAFAFLTTFAQTDGGWVSCSNGCCT